MFNRQPYNRGRFNRAPGQTTGASGISLLKLGVNTVAAMRNIAASGMSNLSLKQQSIGTVVKYSVAAATLSLKATGKGIKEFIVAANPVALSLKADASQTLSGEAFINLESIVLAPGDELVINTCDMTITLNGENAMEYMTNTSEFFNLLTGSNTIEYTDGSEEREINIDVIWKDRWL